MVYFFCCPLQGSLFSDCNAKMCPGGAKSYVGDLDSVQKHVFGFFVQDCHVSFAGPPLDFHLEICNRAALGFSKCKYVGLPWDIYPVLPWEFQLFIRVSG